MSLFSSYDIAEMVIEEASNRFGKSVSEESKSRLKNVCSLIDDLISEYDCESTEFAVNEDTTDLEISLECPDMTIENDSSETFLNVIKEMAEISFSASDGNLKVNLLMRGLWH